MRNRIRRRAEPGALLRAAIRTSRFRILDALGLVRPLKLRIGLTNRCNSRCIMCNIWKQVDNDAPSLEHELLPQEIDAILLRNRRFFSHLKHISLTGGEPTLRNDFVEIWRVLHGHFPEMNMSFNSNGFATPRIARLVEEILTFHRRLTVMISLDGFGENHDRVRGVKGVFPRVLATLETIAAMRATHPLLKVEMNYVMTPINVEDCTPLYEYCRENRIAFNPIYCVQGELYFNENQDNVALTKNARESYIRQFQRILRDDDSLQTREIMDQLLGRPRDFNCWAGRTIFLIEENGNVFPNGGCPTNYLLGNLRDFDYSLVALLQGKQARSVLRRTKPCRLCRLSCETMTTLQHPESLAGYRKSRTAPDLPPGNAPLLPGSQVSLPPSTEHI